MNTCTPMVRLARISLAAGLVLIPALGHGQTIPNPSFEADTFTVFPGYISLNGPITGWTGNPPSNVGLNPAGGTPFANNGAIPHGSKVAFIQSFAGGSATLSTEITGLTAGQKYTVNFRFNARTNNPVQQPNLKIGVDGQPIVNLSTIGVQIGGTTTPYRFGAFDFTAAGSTATLWLTNDVNGDTTVLVDDFTIAVSTNGWSFAPWNDDATSGVDSSKVYTHAYNFGTGALDATVNGVPFKAYPAVNPAIANEFSITGLGSTTTDGANALITAGGGSATLARSFLYGGNPGTFFIAGLVPGMEYVATFYSVAWETGMRAQTFSRGSDRLTINQDHYNNDQGIRIIYRYVAPPSGAVALTQTPTLPGSTFHLYAFANYEADSPALPVVGLQPRSQVTTPGSTVVLSVTAGGVRPLTYQWFKDGFDIIDATNRILVLNNVTADDLGEYKVVVSNANGSTESQPATLTFGMIANPSFEADVFQTWPGYISGNTPISGWVANDPARAGVNPLPEFLGPFANNAAVPDGNQVAFLQSVAGAPKTLQTLLNGLTPGLKYTLSFRACARSDQRPTVRVAVDGQMIGEFRSGPMGGTSPYRYIAFDFTPAAATAVLTLTNDASGDHSILLDDFRLAPSTTQWSFAPWNDDASSGVDSSSAYSHAYNLGGAGVTPDTTINGVRFLGVPGANPSVPGQFAAQQFTGVFGADDNNVVTAGGGSAGLARSFLYYGGTIPADVAQTIILSNLVPGVEYEATIYGVGFDPKAVARAATFTVGEDRQTISEDFFDNNNGLRVTYRYVADASGVQVLTYWPTERTSSFHTYGFANREIHSTTPPVVYRHPQGRTVAAGSTVVLEALAGGQAPLSLQWIKDGVILAGQNGWVLTLAGVTGADTGDYALIVSNAQGVVTSRVATVEVGLAMNNPSFEVDTFTVFPGYISGNFPITGWTASAPAGTGLNPISDGQSPFANNGAIPDGTKVAFIQADGGVLSQVITGMVVGRTYYLKFFENSRAGFSVPRLTVTLGGETIVPTHEVPSGAYVRVISAPFQATAESAELAFIKSAGPAGGDTTVLIDNVAVLDQPPAPPRFVTQPQGAYVKQGQSVTLLAIVQGTLPISYQWQRNGTDVDGATGPTLSLPGILMSQAGSYTLIASNQYGLATSEVALVRVGVAVTELFNTGVAEDGTLAPGGSVDPHYQLIASGDPAWPGPAAWVLQDVWPVQAGVYMLNGPDSKWIAPRVDAAAGNLDANYIYRTAFLLDTQDPSTAVLRGRWAMDNFGLDIRLNGVSQGIVNNTGFGSFAAFTITSGFVAGSNVLDFVISNAPPPGPTALRVELDGVVMPLGPTAPVIVSHPAGLAVSEGQAAVFVALATGSGPLSYQWYWEGSELIDQTNRILRLPSVTVAEAGNYTVEVFNDVGSATSDPALLVVNRHPIPGPDFIAALQDNPVTIPLAKLLFNDSDPDGDPIAITAAGPGTAQGGTVTLTGGALTYRPPTGYTGADQFTYRLNDNRGGSSLGTVNVTVGLTNFLSLVSGPTYSAGRFRAVFAGVPGYPYTIEFATEVTGPWTPLTTVVADANGLIELDDTPEPPTPPTRFYRLTYP